MLCNIDCWPRHLSVLWPVTTSVVARSIKDVQRSLINRVHQVWALTEVAQFQSFVVAPRSLLSSWPSLPQWFIVGVTGYYYL